MGQNVRTNYLVAQIRGIFLVAASLLRQLSVQFQCAPLQIQNEQPAASPPQTIRSNGSSIAMIQFILAIGLSFLAGAAKASQLDCNACGYSCGGWDYFGCSTKKSNCKRAADGFRIYTAAVEATCANDPMRMRGRELIQRSLETIFENGIFTRQEWEQRGVQVRFCSVLKGIKFGPVHWAASGMVPSANKILLSSEFLDWDACSANAIKAMAALLVHEWHHIEQHRVWGSEGFGCRYMDQIASNRGTTAAKGNAVEIEAENVENKAKAQISSVNRGNCPKKIVFENECESTSVRLAIRYKDLSDNWVTKCWWTFDPGRRGPLATSGTTIETKNTLWYSYYEKIDGGIIWSGSDNTKTCKGRVLNMRKHNELDNNGNLNLKLRCSIAEDRDWFKGREIEIENKCSKTTINAAIRFQDAISRKWVTKCWQRVAPGETVLTGSTGGNDYFNRYGAISSYVYYYAENAEGGTFLFNAHGSHDTVGKDVTVNCGGRVLAMLSSSYINGRGSFVASYDNCAHDENNPGRRIDIINECKQTPIRVAIRFQEVLSSEWRTECWTDIGPDTWDIFWDYRAKNELLYYYAESSDNGRVLSGSGSDAIKSVCDGQNLVMEKVRNSIGPVGSLQLYVTCPFNEAIQPGGSGEMDENNGSGLTQNEGADGYGQLTHLVNTACGFGGEGEEDKDFLRWYDVSINFCEDECSRMGDACFGYDFQYRRGRCRIFKRGPTTSINKEGVDCWWLVRPAIATGGSTSLNSANAFNGMFQLKARGRNDCWSLRKGNTEEGTKIVTAKCDAGSESQHFRLDTMEEVFVVIRPRSAGGMYVVGKDVDGTLGPTPEEGTQGSLVLGDLSGKETSYFTFAEPKERDGTTYYSIYMGEYAGENTLYVAFNKDEEGNAIGRGLKTRTTGRMEYVGSMDPGAKFHTEWETLAV